MSFADELKKVLAKKEDSLGIEPGSSDDPIEIDSPSSAILLTEENCGACAFAKEALKNDIEAGKITVCDLANEECKQIGREIGLKEVPAMVVPDENGKLAQCEMGKEGDNLAISCPVMPKQETEEPSVRPPRHGKVGISCMDFRIKNALTVAAKNSGVSQEYLMMIQSLPECETESLGFASVKTGKGGTELKSTSDRMQFMKKCLSGSTGEPQPLRMKRCSQEWRELSAKKLKK